MSNINYIEPEYTIDNGDYILTHGYDRYIADKNASFGFIRPSMTVQSNTLYRIADNTYVIRITPDRLERLPKQHPTDRNIIKLHTNTNANSDANSAQ